MQEKLLTNTGFPVTLVTIIALALERALSVLASGLWRAVVLVFAALIHVFWESVKIMFEIGEKGFYRGLNPLTIPLNITDMCIGNGPRYLSVDLSVILTFLTIAACESRLAFTRVAFRGEAVQTRCVQRTGVLSASVLSKIRMKSAWVCLSVLISISSFSQIKAIVSIDRRKYVVR